MSRTRHLIKSPERDHRNVLVRGASLWMCAMFFVIAAGVGCVQASTVACGDIVCPAGSVCVASGCASPEQASACEQLPDASACSLPNLRNGSCLGGACRPLICGDLIVGFGEVCDDGNGDDGDGCSRDCRSSEVCGNGVLDAVAHEQCDDSVIGLSGDGCSSRCTVEFDSWTDISQPPLPSQSFPRAVYDEHRHVAVLIGTAPQPGEATWEWDGFSWSLRSLIRRPRDTLAFAVGYDPLRRQTVALGFNDSAGITSQTRLWDGERWTIAATTESPPAMFGCGFAFSDARGTLILFGGMDNTGELVNQTWEWNGATWSRVVTEHQPPPRRLLAMARDPLRKKIVLFGGISSAELNDTWEFDGLDWNNVTPTVSPAARLTAGMTFDAVSNEIVMFGGQLASNFDPKVWYWNGVRWLDAATVAASRTVGHTMVQDPATSQLLRVGDLDRADPDNYLLTRDGNSARWQAIRDDGSFFVAANIATDVVTGEVFSVKMLENFSSESHRVQISKWSRNSWHPVATTESVFSFGIPPAASVAVDSRRHLLTWMDKGFVFEWNGQNITKTQDQRRGYGPLVYDEPRNAMLLYDQKTSSLFQWNATQFTAVANSQLPGASSSTIVRWVADPKRKVVLLVTIESDNLGNVTTTQTWTWNGQAWTNQQRAPAVTTANIVLVYQPMRGTVLLHSASAVLEWDGISWTEQFPGASPELLSSAAFDPYSNSVIAVVNRSTYSYRWTSALVPAERCDAGIDSDRDGMIGCGDASHPADPDCWGRCAPACPPNMLCDRSAAHCGDGVCSHIEDPYVCPQDCH
jgi:cysteine-rich repeat protein